MDGQIRFRYQHREGGYVPWWTAWIDIDGSKHQSWCSGSGNEMIGWETREAPSQCENYVTFRAIRVNCEMRGDHEKHRAKAKVYNGPPSDGDVIEVWWEWE